MFAPPQKKKPAAHTEPAGAAPTARVSLDGIGAALTRPPLPLSPARPVTPTGQKPPRREGPGASRQVPTPEQASPGRAPAGSAAARPSSRASLTQPQLVQAKAWYAAQASRYTPAVISQLQAKLGLPKTGVVNDATVQAIARRQAQTAPYPVNGRAGKYGVNGRASAELLTQLFPTGLAQPQQVQAYATSIRALEGRWDALKTPDAKAQALLDVINARLKAAGVPPLGGKVQELGGTVHGQHDFRTWQMDLDPDLLGQKGIGRATADAVYHEARHAEQWFQVARYLAGQGQDARTIARVTGVSPDVVRAAAKQPLAAGTPAGIQAAEWFTSIYGAGAVTRSKTLTQVRQDGAQYTAMSSQSQYYQQTYNGMVRDLAAAVKAGDKEKAKLLQGYLPKIFEEWRKTNLKLDQATTALNTSHGVYVRLPEERDAWQTGGRAGAAYGK